MDGNPVGALYIVGLFCAFALSAFFSVVKIIFSSMEKSAFGADDEHLRYYASKVGGVLKERAVLSSTVVVGKTLSNTAFAALSFYYCNNYLFRDAPIDITGPMLKWGVPLIFSCFVLTLFSHYIPRAFALRFYRSYVAAAYYAYSLLSWLLLPLSWLFVATQSAVQKVIKYDEKLAFLSDEDKARILDSSEGGEALNEEEREMIQSIFDLGDTTVDEIMVPRINIVAADIDSDLQSVLKLITDEGHSRIPVYRDTIDQITGILYARDLLPWLSEHKPEEWDLSSILKKCHYVPMGKKINDLMKEFKMKRLHLAVIVDEYGGTAGIVTMEDILEEIVGDIQDEYDEEERVIVQADGNTYLVDPHIALSDLGEELNVNLEDTNADYNTLGGLIYHEHGDVPQEGTQFERSGLRFTILKMDNQRIGKVKVEVLQSSEAGEDESF